MARIEVLGDRIARMHEVVGVSRNHRVKYSVVALSRLPVRHASVNVHIERVHC